MRERRKECGSKEQQWRSRSNKKQEQEQNQELIVEGKQKRSVRGIGGAGTKGAEVTDSRAEEYDEEC